MDWSKFKHHFHESWHPYMQLFIESQECDDIYAFLKAESQKGKKIAPLSMNTFRCFKETPLYDVKMVLMGMCPYHTTHEGNPVADGLLMGCSVTEKLQPTLSKFYDGLEDELFDGLNLNIIRTPDVSYLAQQGVLMLNSSLTTEIGKAGAHKELWEPLIKFLYEKVLPKNIPTIFLGKDAAYFQKYVHYPEMCLPVSHPASAAYKMGKWDTEGVFKHANKIIWETEKDCIMWLLMDPPF